MSKKPIPVTFENATSCYMDACKVIRECEAILTNMHYNTVLRNELERTVRMAVMEKEIAESFIPF